MTRYKKPLTAKEIAQLSDEDIDTSDIPELGNWFWDHAKVVVPAGAKKQITLRVDPDLLSWFKSKGRGYQTHINAVLRSYYEAHKED